VNVRTTFGLPEQGIPTTLQFTSLLIPNKHEQLNSQCKKLEFTVEHSGRTVAMTFNVEKNRKVKKGTEKPALYISS
jgi:hypothetical protein